MQSQNQQQPGMQASPNVAPQMSHGAHEVFDTHEVIGGMLNTLEHSMMYEQYVKDPELKKIMQHQKNFMTHVYNICVDTFSTGQKPTKSTQVYNMELSNDVMYGLQPGQPKKPAQSINEIGDECVSSYMLADLKALSSAMTMAALETNNPILRRVYADSLPNVIEMAYEVFLYQNKNQYYQVPQLPMNDMNQLIGSYSVTTNYTKNNNQTLM